MLMCYLSRLFYFVFFFSSRRRHTRLVSDWSSDVCSSDLGGVLPGASDVRRSEDRQVRRRRTPHARLPHCWLDRRDGQIGRASCRERVRGSEGGGGVRRKNREQRSNDRDE